MDNGVEVLEWAVERQGRIAYMTPTQLKEFLLLGRDLTGRQLAECRIVNYALPKAAVDAKVAELCGEFLARPVRALARTKCAANKALVNQMNLTMDYAWLSETLDIWELSAQGWQPDLSMHEDEPTWHLGLA